MEEKLNLEWLITLLFALSLGTLGVHRFYNGKITTGILQLITLGGFGIWTLIDIVLILCERFEDKNGKPLTWFVK